jgi:hypothetical protein
MPPRRCRVFAGASPFASAIAFLEGVSACATSKAAPRFTVELPGNAISVWGGAFRINGGANWKLEHVSSTPREFKATYSAGTLQCRFTVTNAPASERNADQLNAETSEAQRDG